MIPLFPRDHCHFETQEAQTLGAFSSLQFPTAIIIVHHDGQGHGRQVSARRQEQQACHGIAKFAPVPKSPAVHLLLLLTTACVQGFNGDDLARARQNLADEANIAAKIPEHPNLLQPVAILYDDQQMQHVGGLVYPLMEGGDVFSAIS